MEGRRAEKKPDAGKKGFLIAGIAIVVVVAAYLGLCAWVGASNRIMPNVSVAGLDVSGMTAEQAQAAVTQAVETYGDDAAVTLRYGAWSGTLAYTEFQMGGHTSGADALEVGRTNFLSQGFQYIWHLLGGSAQVDLALEALDPAQPALDRLLDQAEETVGGGVIQTSYQVVEDQLVVTKGVTGAAFDRERVALIAAEAVSEAMKEAVDQQGAANVQVDLAEQDVIVETPPDELEYNGLWQEIYTEPQDAKMDPETYEITDHVVGVEFDESALESAYETAAEGETFSIPLILTQPKETTESLNAKLFADLLGEGTTKVGGSANRKSNVKLSAQACNGVILMPGEIFSYNNTTGSRTADKGYLAAPVYSGGASVEEVGGGICQTSSTIYYAVLHTNLEIVERRCHQYNTGYVDPGMDATVYYGLTDFRFKNSTDYPIKIVTESYDKNGARYLTVKIYGTNEEGIYAIPKSTTYDQVTPTTQYKADGSIPQGTTRVDTVQNAYTGLKAQTYRYVYDKNGNLLEKQNMGVSTYQMRPKTILYNPADGDPSTWVNGVPPQPGTTTDPGTETGGSTDPVITDDPIGGTEENGGQTDGGESTGAEPESQESSEGASGEGQETQPAA